MCTYHYQTALINDKVCITKIIVLNFNLNFNRLTEARAKLELREEATEQDALDVVEIMKSCMVDTIADNLGILDFSRSHMGWEVE